MANKLSFQCKAYYDPDGAANGNWQLLKRIKDTIEVGNEDEQVDGSDFDSEYKKYLGGQTDVPVEFTIKTDDANPAWQALAAAKAERKDIGVAFTNADIATPGTLIALMADFRVLTFSLTRQQNDIEVTKVVLGLSAESTFEPIKNGTVA